MEVITFISHHFYTNCKLHQSPSEHLTPPLYHLENTSVPFKVMQVPTPQVQFSWMFNSYTDIPNYFAQLTVKGEESRALRTARACLEHMDATGSSDFPLMKSALQALDTLASARLFEAAKPYDWSTRLYQESGRPTWWVHDQKEVNPTGTISNLLRARADRSGNVWTYCSGGRIFSVATLLETLKDEVGDLSLFTDDGE